MLKKNNVLLASFTTGNLRQAWAHDRVQYISQSRYLYIYFISRSIYVSRSGYILDIKYISIRIKYSVKYYPQSIKLLFLQYQSQNAYLRVACLYHKPIWFCLEFIIFYTCNLVYKISHFVLIIKIYIDKYKYVHICNSMLC